MTGFQLRRRVVDVPEGTPGRAQSHIDGNEEYANPRPVMVAA
jgi:hypothetical protein